MNEPAAQNNDPLEDPIDDPLTGHNYDGIQEYDNPMPGWWKMLFVLTIIYAFPYMYYYHGAKADRSIHTAYDEAVAANLRLQFAEIGELQPNAETILEYSEDDKWLQVGKTVFKTHCISCHGENGLGKVGPNL